MYYLIVIIGAILIAFALGLVVISVSFLAAALFGAPFVPSDRKNVAIMTLLAKAGPGKRIVDVGSGDGRILIALARAGAEAHGYEINPVLVWFSRLRIRGAGLSGKAFVHRKDYHEADLREFDVVTVYGIDYMMHALSEKCARELPAHAFVISNGFSLPGWREERREGQVRCYRREEPTR